MTMHIRPATLADLPAISRIYNHYVPISTCTYDLEPETLETRKKWFEKHSPRHPVIVAEIDGQVAGWASLGVFRERPAYVQTVENSVYVDAAHHRRGIALELMRRLIELARQHGHRTIVAMIDAEQANSVALHAKLGFVHTGRLLSVGRKFDRWLDVIVMQLMV